MRVWVDEGVDVGGGWLFCVVLYFEDVLCGWVVIVWLKNFCVFLCVDVDVC